MEHYYLTRSSKVRANSTLRKTTSVRKKGCKEKGKESHHEGANKEIGDERLRSWSIGRFVFPSSFTVPSSSSWVVSRQAQTQVQVQVCFDTLCLKQGVASFHVVVAFLGRDRVASDIGHRRSKYSIFDEYTNAASATLFRDRHR